MAGSPWIKENVNTSNAVLSAHRHTRLYMLYILRIVFRLARMSDFGNIRDSNNVLNFRNSILNITADDGRNFA